MVTNIAFEANTSMPIKYENKIRFVQDTARIPR